MECAIDTSVAVPVTVLQARRGWRSVDVSELWRHRELLCFLAWRDVKIRYKQTLLGAAWAVLQPLATMVVLTLFVGRLSAGGSDGLPYPLFVLAGLLPWTYFANTIGSASQSVVTNQNVISKVYFPRLLMPLSAAVATAVDFTVSLGLLAAIMFWYGVPAGPGLLLVPAVMFGLAMAALGVGTMLAALTVAYRDFRYVVPFALQLWLFATPCIYLRGDASVAAWNLVLGLNPAYGLIANFRLAILSRPLDLPLLAVSLAVSVIVLGAGCAYFRRVERSFADVI